VLCRRRGEKDTLFTERVDHVEQRENSHDTRNIGQLGVEVATSMSGWKKVQSRRSLY
jgi:hypothetical protein